jgi:hypothetical protein
LSARSGWAEVKALLERRGCVPFEGTTEGEAEGSRVVEIAQRYYLDPPIKWGAPDGGSAGGIRAPASIDRLQSSPRWTFDKASVFSELSSSQWLAICTA